MAFWEACFKVERGSSERVTVITVNAFSQPLLKGVYSPEFFSLRHETVDDALSSKQTAAILKPALIIGGLFETGMSSQVWVTVTGPCQGRYCEVALLHCSHFTDVTLT